MGFTFLLMLLLFDFSLYIIDINYRVDGGGGGDWIYSGQQNEERKQGEGQQL